MSASNWTICPRCEAQGRAQWKADHEAVMATYGIVPVEDFDAERARVADAEPSSEAFRTLREDYSWRINEGFIYGDYECACTECGYSAESGVVEPLPAVSPTNQEGR